MKKVSCLLIVLSILFVMTSVVFAQPIAPVYYPDTGNYYDVINGSFKWYQAEADAQGRNFEQCVGHLVTITSASENQFLVNNGLAISWYWIGGYQDPNGSEPAVGWQWVTGESFVYSNWLDGQPDDGYNGEDHIQFLTPEGSPIGKWNDRNSEWINNGYVIEYECPEVIQVDIDIKPGSFPNSINLNGHGVIPVAIFGHASFNVSTISIGTLRLDGLLVSVKGNGRLQCSFDNVNEDSFDDLVCHFADDGTSLSGDTALLSGVTTAGQAFEGSDSINLIPR